MTEISASVTVFHELNDGLLGWFITKDFVWKYLFDPLIKSIQTIIFSNEFNESRSEKPWHCLRHPRPVSKESCFFASCSRLFKLLGQCR